MCNTNIPKQDQYLTHFRTLCLTIKPNQRLFFKDSTQYIIQIYAPELCMIDCNYQLKFPSYIYCLNLDNTYSYTMDFLEDLALNNDAQTYKQIGNEIGPWIQSPIKRNQMPIIQESKKSFSREDKFLAKLKLNKTISNYYFREGEERGHIEEEKSEKSMKHDHFENFSEQRFFRTNKELSKTFRIRETTNNTVQWEPIPTTTYVYDNFQKKDKSHTLFNDAMKCTQPNNGCRNLQRMLKMREKIRIKNSSYVKKLKQRTNAERQCFPSCDKKIRDYKWKSTVLVADPEIYENYQSNKLKTRKLSYNKSRN